MTSMMLKGDQKLLAATVKNDVDSIEVMVWVRVVCIGQYEEDPRTTTNRTNTNPARCQENRIAVQNIHPRTQQINHWQDQLFDWIAEELKQHPK